jgi:hypothetical protein
VRQTLITLVILIVGSASSAATASNRAQPSACRSLSVPVVGKARCGGLPARRAVFGTVSRAGWRPDGIEHRAITVSVLAFADRAGLVCSLTCSEGAAGAFSAHFAPLIDPIGYMPPVAAEFDISGSVLCLTFLGNNAVVGGLIEHSTVPAAIGRAYFFVISDRGYPGVDRDVLHGYFGPPSASPFECSGMFGPGGYAHGISNVQPNVEQGNFVVTP